MKNVSYYAIVNKEAGKYVSNYRANGPIYSTNVEKIDWIFSLFTFKDTERIANRILQAGLKAKKSWAMNSEVVAIPFTPELIKYQKERFSEHLEMLRKEAEMYSFGDKVYNEAKEIYNSIK